VLEEGDPQAEQLNSCCYFQFGGPADALWDPVFNARLAWEGFFTITSGGPGGGGGAEGAAREPLPELQPYYGVLTWQNFHQVRRPLPHSQPASFIVRALSLSLSLMCVACWRLRRSEPAHPHTYYQCTAY
jgi:hypothetical protein